MIHGRGRQLGVGAALAGAVYRAAQNQGVRNVVRAVYNEGRKAYRRPAKRKKMSKAPGGAGTLRTRKPISKRRWLARKRKCRPMRAKKLTKKVCRIEKSIRELKLAENASLGTFVLKTWYTSALKPAQAAQANYVAIGCDMGRFTDACQYLKYYNPATPGTLTTANFETGTYSRTVLFKSMYFSMEMRNNYQTDCKIRIYLCTPKGDHSISPSAAWTNGVTAASTATGANELGQYPTEYEEFNALWAAKVHCKATLSPGQSVTCSHTVRNVEFDPVVFDSKSDTYQRKYKNFMFLAVAEGTLAHDTAAVAEQGIAPAGLDILMKRVTTVQYDAGVNIKYFRIENNTDTFTNGAVQSHQPLPDNVGYSVS